MAMGLALLRVTSQYSFAEAFLEMPAHPPQEFSLPSKRGVFYPIAYMWVPAAAWPEMLRRPSDFDIVTIDGVPYGRTQLVAAVLVPQTGITRGQVSMFLAATPRGMYLQVQVAFGDLPDVVRQLGESNMPPAIADILASLLHPHARTDALECIESLTPGDTHWRTVNYSIRVNFLLGRPVAVDPLKRSEVRCCMKLTSISRLFYIYAEM